MKNYCLKDTALTNKKKNYCLKDSYKTLSDHTTLSRLLLILYLQRDFQLSNI